MHSFGLGFLLSARISSVPDGSTVPKLTVPGLVGRRVYGSLSIGRNAEIRDLAVWLSGGEFVISFASSRYSSFVC